MTAHSTLGASGANRWFNCPGAPALIEKSPPQGSNQYADQGTAAHWVLEQCLRDNKDPYDYLGEEIDITTDRDEDEKIVVMDEEDIEAVAEAIGYVQEFMDEGGYKLLLETRVELGLIHKKLFGTADIILVKEDLSKAIILDYKHGKGVPVDATYYDGKGREQGNLQLMYYGLGGINYVSKTMCDGILDVMGWDAVFGEVHIGVIQPRCRHADGALRMWKVPNGELQKYADKLKQKALATEKKNAPLCSGSWCRWCPALPNCGAFSKKANELARVDFKAVATSRDLKLPDAAILSPEDVAKIISFEPIISDWLKMVKAQGQRMLQNGHEVPGYKLVTKKTNRKWTDEEDTILEIDEHLPFKDMYKLLSPAQIEKAFVDKKQGKKIVAELCYKPEGGVTMAPEHDKRDAVRLSAADDFK